MLKRSLDVDNAPNKFKLKIKIKKMLATQERLPSKIMDHTTEFEKTAETNRKQGTEEKEKLADVNRKKKTSTKRTAKAKCHCFTRKDGHIYEPLGGSYGHLKRLARKVGMTLGKNLYSSTALGLIRFQPEYVDLGEDKDIGTEWMLQQRNLPRPPFKVMIWQPFEKVENRTAEIVMEVSRVCPLSAKEVTALLVGMRDFDGFGATGRGIIESIEILK